MWLDIDFHSHVPGFVEQKDGSHLKLKWIRSFSESDLSNSFKPNCIYIISFWNEWRNQVCLCHRFAITWICNYKMSEVNIKYGVAAFWVWSKMKSYYLAILVVCYGHAVTGKYHHCQVVWVCMYPCRVARSLTYFTCDICWGYVEHASPFLASVVIRKDYQHILIGNMFPVSLIICTFSPR